MISPLITNQCLFIQIKCKQFGAIVFNTRLFLFLCRSSKMCIIFFILNENAKDGEWKLILASNRDEHYERPALVAGPWKEDKSVVGGRDMEPGREGGSWLAISTKDNTFKFAALLNITGEKRDDDPLPRGNIVPDYVKGSLTNAQYCQNLTDYGQQFNHFNLVTIEMRQVNQPFLIFV